MLVQCAHLASPLLFHSPWPSWLFAQRVWRTRLAPSTHTVVGGRRGGFGAAPSGWLTFRQGEPHPLAVCLTPAFKGTCPKQTTSQVLSLGVLWFWGPSGTFWPCQPLVAGPRAREAWGTLPCVGPAGSGRGVLWTGDTWGYCAFPTCAEGAGAAGLIALTSLDPASPLCLG